MSLAITPAPWTERALCAQVGSDFWYPEKGGDSGKEAKKVCAACPVREECLQDALQHYDRYGIWGGLSVKERRKLVGPLRICKAGGCEAEFDPGSSHAVFCSDACRRGARNKSYDDCVKAYLCIQCGSKTTAVRCVPCAKRHGDSLVQPRTAA